LVKNLFKIAVSFVFLFYIAHKLEWRIIKHTLTQINVFAYILSTLIVLISPIFLAKKYRLFIKKTSLTLSTARLMVIDYISHFYALFLPSALGPEAVRWYKITKDREGKSFFLAATIFERLIFLMILLAFGTLPLFLNSENMQIVMLRKRIAPLLGVSFLFLSIGLFFFFMPQLKNRFLEIMTSRFPALKNSKIHQFFMDFEIKQQIDHIIAPILILSLLWQLFFLARIYFLFLSLNLPLGFMEAAWMGSLVLLLQALPVSFAGIGVREGAYAYLFTLFEIAPEKGVLIGVLFFIQVLILAGIGAFLNLFEK